MKYSVITILLSIFCFIPAAAQLAAQKYEVGQLRFEGNETLSDDQLRNVMNTHETPWVVWKWIYHIFDKEILGGQKPSYFDLIAFSTDFYQVKRFYRDNGFVHSQIDTSISVQPEKEKVFLTFLINEGKRSLIDTIVYRALKIFRRMYSTNLR